MADCPNHTCHSIIPNKVESRISIDIQHHHMLPRFHCCVLSKASIVLGQLQLVPRVPSYDPKTSSVALVHSWRYLQLHTVLRHICQQSPPTMRLPERVDSLLYSSAIELLQALCMRAHTWCYVRIESSCVSFSGKYQCSHKNYTYCPDPISSNFPWQLAPSYLW